MLNTAASGDGTVSDYSACVLKKESGVKGTLEINEDMESDIEDRAHQDILSGCPEARYFVKMSIENICLHGIKKILKNKGIPSDYIPFVNTDTP